MSGRNDFAGALARIATSARATNGARAQEVDRAVQQQRAGQLDAAGRVAAARAAHQLAGSAGTFGDHGVVEPARRLEAHFTGGEDEPDEAVLADVRSVLVALGAEQGPGPHR